MYIYIYKYSGDPSSLLRQGSGDRSCNQEGHLGITTNADINVTRLGQMITKGCLSRTGKRLNQHEWGEALK